MTRFSCQTQHSGLHVIAHLALCLFLHRLKLRDGRVRKVGGSLAHLPHTRIFADCPVDLEHLALSSAPLSLSPALPLSLS